MCGRFVRRASPDAVADEFDLSDVPVMEPQYNIAPTQAVAVVRQAAQTQERELAILRWGLIPSWADDPSYGNKLANARSETVATKPSFRSAFRSRRCLLIADGFYEWQTVDGHKQPYFIRLKSDRPFGIAGLWERWDKGEQPIESCALLTTDANDLMKPIHDRMPVIIPRELYDLWLDPRCQDKDKLQQLLRPHSPAEMLSYPVNKLVNNARNNVSQCIVPLEL